MGSLEQRIALRERLGECRRLRASHRLSAMNHGRAVALGLPHADDYLALARRDRKELKAIQLRLKMYRVVREAAKEMPR